MWTRSKRLPHTIYCAYIPVCVGVRAAVYARAQGLYGIAMCSVRVADAVAGAAC